MNDIDNSTGGRTGAPGSRNARSARTEDGVAPTRHPSAPGTRAPSPASAGHEGGSDATRSDRPTASSTRDPRHAARDATRRQGLDPGAFVGRKPERQAETIPGGITHKDQRIAAVASQPGPTSSEANTPAGHREGANATDDTVREAGQNR
jgi:hypothetical protein